MDSAANQLSMEPEAHLNLAAQSTENDWVERRRSSRRPIKSRRWIDEEESHSGNSNSSHLRETDSDSFDFVFKRLRGESKQQRCRPRRQQHPSFPLSTLSTENIVSEAEPNVPEEHCSQGAASHNNEGAFENFEKDAFWDEEVVRSANIHVLQSFVSPMCHLDVEKSVKSQSTAGTQGKTTQPKREMVSYENGQKLPITRSQKIEPENSKAFSLAKTSSALSTQQVDEAETVDQERSIDAYVQILNDKIVNLRLFFDVIIVF